MLRISQTPVGIWWRWKPETNHNVVFLKEKYTILYEIKREIIKFYHLQVWYMLIHVMKHDMDSNKLIFSYFCRDYYFTAVSWVRSDAIAVIWMNRAQNISLVTECNQPTWICKKVSFVYHLSQFVFLWFFDHIAYTSHKREPQKVAKQGYNSRCSFLISLRR